MGMRELRKVKDKSVKLEAGGNTVTEVSQVTGVKNWRNPVRREPWDRSLGCGARRGLEGEGVLCFAEGNSLLLIRMARCHRSGGLQAGE